MIVKCALFVVVLTLLALPLGTYMTRVYDGRLRFLSALERLIYKVCAPVERWRGHGVARVHLLRPLL